MKFGWKWSVGIGFLGWLFMYADRAILSPALPGIAADFHVGGFLLGMIATAFFLAYTALQIPIGLWADKVNPGWILTVGVVGFGVFTVWMGASSTYAEMLGTSILAGAFQGFYYPTQFAIAVRVIPSRGRTLAASIINSGMGLGIAIGFVIASMVRTGAWRQPFWQLGVATIAFGLVTFVPSVRLGAQKSQAGDASVTSGSTDAHRAGWYYVINFTSLFGFFFILTWFPYYAHTTWHLVGAGEAVYTAIIPVLSVVGAIGWAIVADRGYRGRLLALLLLAAAISLGSVAVWKHVGIGLVVSLVGYGLTGKLVVDPLIVAELATQVPPEKYGQTYGFLNFSGMLGSILAPLVAGWFLARGQLADAFWLSMLLLLAGAAMAWRVAENRRPTAPTKQT